MINYETILSLFDDKLTLLEYLTKIEKALKDSTLTEITIEQPTETTAIFTFVFENGDTIVTPSVTLPRGEKGDTGDKGDKGDKGDTGATGANGVSVVSAHFNNQYHLILTLSNSDTIDAGKVKNCYIADVGVLTIGGETTSFSLSATDRANIADEDINVIIKFQNGTGGVIYYMTKKYITDTGTHYFNLQTVATNGSVISYSANIDTTVASQTLYSKTLKTTASAIDSSTATAGQVLTADGNGGAGWQSASGGGTTLNKYTYTATNPTNTTFYNNFIAICENAKGQYHGDLKATINSYSNLWFNVKDITLHGSGGYWYLTGIAKYQTTMFICYMVLSSSPTTASYMLVIDLTTGTITSTQITSFSIASANITYYNDTQLHT